MNERLKREMKPYPSNRKPLPRVQALVSESLHPDVLDELLKGNAKPSFASFLEEHADVKAKFTHVAPEDLASRLEEEKPHFVVLSANRVTVPEDGRKIMESAKKSDVFVIVRGEKLPKWASGAHHVTDYKPEQRKALLKALVEHLRK